MDYDGRVYTCKAEASADLYLMLGGSYHPGELSLFTLKEIDPKESQLAEEVMKNPSIPDILRDNPEKILPIEGPDIGSAPHLVF